MTILDLYPIIIGILVTVLAYEVGMDVCGRV